MLIYPPAHSQALARIWMVVYLLDVAVRSELARGKGLHLLSVAVRSELARSKGLRLLSAAVRGELARRIRGRASLIRSQGSRRLHILGTESSGKGVTSNLCTRDQ